LSMTSKRVMMLASDDDLVRRLHRAQEALDTELKPWIDPATDVGKAVIAKTCIALRNNSGGFLLIGINDDGSCLNEKVPSDIPGTYHADVIHEIISKYSSDPFEVRVHFVERDGHPRVMIEVPPGVRTPVFCRNDLPRTDSATHKAGSLLALNDVYVRTLVSNGRFSSAQAQATDWHRLTEFCFNNREADIGGFIRRQLAGLDVTSFVGAFQEILHAVKTPTPVGLVDDYLERSYERYVELRNKDQRQIPDVGTRECAAVIIGPFATPELSQEYMMRFIGVPRHSGWPPWVGLLNIHSSLGSVAYIDEGWQSFEYVTEMFPSLDFSRMDASGKFYSLEGLRDDLVKNVPPRQHLEFVIETARVAEILAMCLLFAKEFCGADSANELSVAFRWRGLADRHLSAWANPDRGFRTRNVASQDEFVTHVTVPVAIAPDAIGPHVEAVLKPLFRLFGGWEFQSRVLQQIVTDRVLNNM
jgi:hypothetical protein